MMTKKRGTPFLQKICTIITFYLAVSSIFPPIRVFQGYTLSCVIAMIAWIICAGIANPSFFTIFSKKPIHKQMILIFVLYTFIIPYLFGNETIGNRYLFYGQVLIFYIIYQYNRTYGFENSSKFIIKLSFPFIIITSIITLYGLVSNPYLSRSIKSGGDHTIMLQAQGIGGYEFIYFLVFVNIMLLYLMLNKKNLKIKYQTAIYVLLILFVFTVIYSNYFTALIMIITSLVIQISMRQSGILSRVLIVITGAVSLVFGKNLLMTITKWLISNLDSGRTLERLLILQAELLGTSNESLLAVRTSTLEISWKSFLENPIFGIILKPIEFDGGFLTGFGQHSHFVDTLALYGIFVGLIGFYIAIQPFFKRFKGPRRLSSLNLAMLVSTLLLFGLNNVTQSIGYAIFFIYPVLYDWQFDSINYKT